MVKCDLMCADLSEMLVERSVLANVNGKVWDMNRPLEDDCKISFSHFKQLDTFHVNNVSAHTQLTRSSDRQTERDCSAVYFIYI